ncbi:MAG: DUF6544 family protein [Candidatus Promineifilaceae bacterium]|nr:DUF6544 family protein [Candidatus Promineifilaceae bacterium]
MIRIMVYLATAVVLLHGLVHLIGFVAYWPLAEIAGLPYKTTLLGQRWAIDSGGMRLYSVLWLGTAVALVAATAGLIAGRSWGLPLMTAAVIVSLIITALDWGNAFRGFILNLVLLVPLLLVWGLRVQPQPFSAYPGTSSQLYSMPMPDDLPSPVARYYQTIVGERIPVIESAVITAHGTVRFAGITFPARMRFIHEAGLGYRHYIEATFFGYPLMKVNERYLDGQARMEIPGGVVENESKVDMAANLGLWGESIWLPSIYLTDPRVRWEAIDDNTAMLVVPFAEGQDSFKVNFDPESGLIANMEALRYREATDVQKIPWLLEPLAWKEHSDLLIPSRSAATWADEGTPWLIVEVDQIVYNVDVDEYIRARGA